MTTLPGLQKGITKDTTPPATDTQVSPITIPDGTTLLTTKLHNEIVDNEDQLIDYISGDNSPNFIPQSAIANLVTDLSNKQPLDSDLTSIAGLTPVDDDIIQRKAGAWINRTPIQFKVDLALVKADVGLGNVDNTSDADKPVSTATQTALDLKEDSLGFTPEDSANKGAISGYAALDASQELLLVNFPSGTSLQVLRRNVGNTALEFFTLSDLQGVTSINGDTTAAQIIAAGTGLGIVDAGATHTISIDSTVVTLTGVQTLTNKTIDGDLNTILDINETQMTVSVGIAGTILTSNGVGIPPTYQSAGNGDVIGPASATDNAIARFDTATGKLIQNGIITIDDVANIIAIRSLQFNTFTSAPLGTTHIALVDGDFHINTTAGNSIQIMIDDNAEFQFDATTLDLMDNNLVMGTSFIQFSSIAEPGVSGSDTVGRVFMDIGNNNHLSIRRNGTSIDLESTSFIGFTADADLDMGAFDIDMNSNNLLMGDGEIQFTTVGTTISEQLSDLIFDITGGNFFSFDISGTAEYTFTANGLTMFNNALVMGSGEISFGADRSIGASGTDLQYDVATGDAHIFRVDNSTEYSFDDTEADFNSNNIIDMGSLAFDGSGLTAGDAVTNIWSESDGMHFNVPTNGDFFWAINGFDRMRFTDTALDFLTARSITNVIAIDFDSNSDHNISDTSTTMDINTNAGQTTNIRSDGNIEYGFGTTEADFNGNNLINFGFLESDAADVAQSGTVRLGNAQLFAFRDAGDANDFTFGVTAGNSFSMIGSGGSEYAWSSSKFDTVGKDIDLSSGDILETGFHDFNEIATPANPAADVGRLYVKDVSTVTTLFFRDSAGTETDLLAGGPSPIGLHDIWLDSGAFIPVDSGAVATRLIGTGANQKSITYVPFLTGVDTYVVAKFKLPRNYDNGTITVVINWTTETEAAGDVEWAVSGVAAADGDDLSSAGLNYGSAITVIDTQSTINESQDTSRTSAITLGNTPSDGDTIYLKIQRTGTSGSDTFGQDAQLLGIYLELTTDAAVSA